MSTYLLDSNLIIYATQTGHVQLRAFIEDEVPFISVVSKIETLGYHKLKVEEKSYLENFFQASRIIHITQEVVEEAIKLRQQKRISLGDSLIAATAISHELKLATHNIADFKWIDDLNLIDPLDEM